jgi:hypothetical protein
MLSDLIPKYDASLFSEIHQLPTFLPAEENEDTLRMIASVIGVITVMHLFLLWIVKVWMGFKRDKVGDRAASSSSASAEDASRAAWKASYQLTNLLVNLVLGCMGIYYQINHVPWGESAMNKIVGYEHVKHFAVGQIGYQLWALPIGIFFVDETPTMLVHHVAVICVCSVSAFVTCGFRYYTPYFYGLIEISSVPLSIMNSFKNNKHWIKAYPEAYSLVRLVFALAFLLVRVVLWTPFYWSFWFLESMLLYSSESISTKVILTLFSLSSLVLTFLQYFWASKILAAMVKGAPKKKAA